MVKSLTTNYRRKVTIIKFFKRITIFRPIYELENVFNSLQQLAIFLREEVNSFGVLHLIKFLISDEDGISGNMFDMDKKGNDVYITDLYYQGLESERKYFIIPISELIKLVKRWDKLMKEKPEEIILSEHNGKFELVGKNNSRELRGDAEC